MSETDKNLVQKEGKPSVRHNDEIDLLDLFLVFVRYRKMILGLTFAAICVSIIGYFLYPQYQYRQAEAKNNAEVRLEIAESAALKSQSASYNLQDIYTRPHLLLQALQDAGFTEYTFYQGVEADLTDEQGQSRALFLIQQRLIDNKSLDGNELQGDKRLITVEKTNAGIMLIFTHQEIDRATAFIESLYRLGCETLEQELTDELEATITAHEQLLEIDNPGENLAQRIVADQRRYDQAKKIQTGEKKLLMPIHDAYEVQPEISLNSFRGDFKIKGIVLTAAVFLLSIFLAFVLNLISSIRRDEASMEKIRKALNKE